MRRPVQGYARAVERTPLPVVTRLFPEVLRCDPARLLLFAFALISGDEPIRPNFAFSSDNPLAYDSDCLPQVF